MPKKFKHNIIVTDAIERLTLDERGSATLLISIKGETGIVIKNRCGVTGAKMAVADLAAYIAGYLAASL